jgi:superfamily I DNA/RNA helicase/RecB family exonuclease
MSAVRDVMAFMGSSVRYRLDTSPPPAVRVPRLDGAQQQVVDHRGGPLLVLAGPGTGKTTTLVEVVVDRVERDGLTPGQVLVLTFSRKAADELRERITARLGRTVAEPAAYTFHSWCYALVRAFEVTPGADPPRLLSGAERDVRVHELLKGNAEGEGQTRWPETLGPALRLRGFAREVADLLDRARERGLDGPGLRELGDSCGRPEWSAAGVFLDEYLAVLAARDELDYAGLVARAVDLMRDPVVVAAVRARYSVVVVDEYQDTDPAQEELLRLLAGGGRELVVVGDPDQAIYGFRGADVDAILAFPERFRTAGGEAARTIALQHSRRAGAPLLDASRRVAARIPVHGPVASRMREHRDLEAAGPDDSAPPEVSLYATVAEEVTAVADLLRRAHLDDGVPWSDMAVLVRSGVRSIPVLRRAFATTGVPVAVAADEVVLARDPAVAPLLTALEVARRGWAHLQGDDGIEAATLLLQSPLGRVQSPVLRALGRRLRALDRADGAALPRPSGAAIRDALVDPRDLVRVDDWCGEPVQRLHMLLDRAITQAADGGSPEEVLWTLWDSSGWGRRLAADSLRGGDAGHAADRDLDAGLALFDAAGRLEDRRPHAGVGALLEEITAQQLPAAPMEERPGAGGSVRLLTAHRAKGLEWDVVVVCGVQEGVWPDLRRRGSLLAADGVDTDGPREPVTVGRLLADERRLFYVACTRARRRLVVTAVQSLDDGGDRPSRFLSELLPEGAALPDPSPAGTRLLSVHSLVARLRRALHDDAASPTVQAAAAGELARLAASTDDLGTLVPSAHPDAWWGLFDVTEGARPLRDPAEPVALSASAVVGFERCPLRWFLEREVHARGASSASQGFGTVVHALAQAVSEGTLEADPDVLLDALDTVWSRLGFEAPWQRERDRVEARAVIERFLRWHEAGGREVLEAEQAFDFVTGDARLRGSVDRVERDGEGRLHVVDLKTGKSKPKADEMPTDAQLGVYQLAVRSGSLGVGAPGGGELVQLRQGLADGMPKVQRQEALLPGVTWADELVASVAARIRAEELLAKPGDHCGSCDLRGSCPSQPEGRQVLPWPS